MTAVGTAARVEVRPAAEGDLPGLAALFEERFGHAWSPAERTWKYRALPGEARSWVAVRGERVLAHAGALRLEARLPCGVRRGIWQLTDWMGSVEDGGLRPPLVVLGRRLLADLPGPADAPWIFGFPSDRHLALGERTFGYLPLAPVRPLGGELARAVDAAGGEAGAEIPPREVTDRCGDWAEAAWTACGVPSVRRSVAFLNWRYHARPGRYYRVYRIAPADGAGPDGLAVFAFVGSLARGAELWLPPAPSGAGTQRERWAPSLRAVAHDLLAAGLESWQLWPPPAGSGLAPLLDGLGLRPAGAPVTMGCRGRGGTTDGSSPADPDFHYAMGDYDAV